MMEDLAEALLLAVGAFLIGMTLARAGLPLFLRWVAPTEPPRWHLIEIRPITFIFALAAAVGAASAVWIIGSLRRYTGDLILRDAWRGSAATRPASVLHFGLAAGQVALALIVANGAGLMLRSSRNIANTDRGIETESALTFEILLSDSYGTNERISAFYRDLGQALSGLSGVTHAGATNFLPLQSSRALLRVAARARSASASPWERARRRSGAPWPDECSV